jgi:hypothetical protein
MNFRTVCLIVALFATSGAALAAQACCDGIAPCCIEAPCCP